MGKKYVIRFGETLLGRKNTEIIEELFEVAKWERSRMIYMVFDRLISMYDLEDKSPEEIYYFITAWAAGLVNESTGREGAWIRETAKETNSQQEYEAAEDEMPIGGVTSVTDGPSKDNGLDMFDFELFRGGSTKSFRD